MKRKDLFLNNDFSMMLLREQNPKPDFGKVWEEEQNELHRAANAIIKNRGISCDAKKLMARSARYAGTEDYYQKIYIEGSDAEQLKELRSLEYAASLTLLSDAVLIAGGDLIDKEDYGVWIELLYSLQYVPMQKAFCYHLARHKDFIGVLNVLDIKRLAYPQTFLWSLLDHWFEWLTRVGGHLLTYSDEKCNYEKNVTVQKLQADAAVVKTEWEENLPIMIHEIMAGFSKFLHPDKMLVWATKEPLRDDANSNQYSVNYNRCLFLLCNDLSQVVNLNTVPDEDLNLNLILLMAEKAVGDNDTVFGKEIYIKLLNCLLNENFSSIEKKSELDGKRQRIIGQLIVLVFPDFDFTRCIKDVATRFQGWNMDYHQMYYEARREAYLACSLFSLFEVQMFDAPTRFALWKNLVDFYVREYRRCENGYIMRDVFSIPFRVAVEVVEKMQDENCREYLHEIIVVNILGIVSLLTIFSECSMFLSRKTVDLLIQRIDVEWPSAKMLMSVRGQKTLEAQIESLIEQLKRTF